MPKVHVPQEDGSITVSRSGQAKTRQVTDHIVEVADADLNHFLKVVPDAELAEDDDE